MALNHEEYLKKIDKLARVTREMVGPAQQELKRIQNDTSLATIGVNTQHIMDLDAAVLEEHKMKVALALMHIEGKDIGDPMTWVRENHPKLLDHYRDAGVKVVQKTGIEIAGEFVEKINAQLNQRVRG